MITAHYTAMHTHDVLPFITRIYFVTYRLRWPDIIQWKIHTFTIKYSL